MCKIRKVCDHLVVRLQKAPYKLCFPALEKYCVHMSHSVFNFKKGGKKEGEGEVCLSVAAVVNIAEQYGMWPMWKGPFYVGIKV